MVPPSRAAQSSNATTTRTTTITSQQQNNEATSSNEPEQQNGALRTLRLRGYATPRQGIRWAEDVVDNEGLGRKKSKVCCIYHKPREFGESSSESSSSSSSESESDSDADQSTARRSGQSRKNLQKHNRDCDHEHPKSGDEVKDLESGCNGERPGTSEGPRRKARKRSPNAYEKMPTPRSVGNERSQKPS